MRPVNTNRINLFREFLNNVNLMDLDLKRCKYTWISNPRGGITTRDKLDRVLVNWAWRDTFSHAMGTTLPIIISDHSRIVLNHKPSGLSGNYFKYGAF